MKHGLFAQQRLTESVDRLGEDKREFDLHLRLFERAFAPGDEEERQIVRGLARTVWRRLRFFHAQARWEKEKLHRVFAEAPAPAQLSLEDTVARAQGLALALMQFDAFFRELGKLESQVESRLRKLIRKTFPGGRPTLEGSNTQVGGAKHDCGNDIIRPFQGRGLRNAAFRGGCPSAEGPPYGARAWHFKEPRSALASIPDRSHREIADLAGHRCASLRTARPPAAEFDIPYRM